MSTKHDAHVWAWKLAAANASLPPHKHILTRPIYVTSACTDIRPTINKARSRANLALRRVRT